ncbi:MAG: hypothetical protein GY771_01920, partial [bacterium]|nr:hypothetical protein [bacterium]
VVGVFVAGLGIGVMLLMGIEVIVGERKRAARFGSGFFRGLIVKSDGSFWDSVIFAFALLAVFFAVRASDMFYSPRYVFIAIPVVLLIISFALWVSYSIIRKRGLGNIAKNGSEK